MKVHVHVDGIGKLSKRLSSQAIKDEIKDWVKYFAKFTVNKLKEHLSTGRTNRSTGKLKRSIQSSIGTLGYTSNVSVGKDIPYANWAEEGIKGDGRYITSADPMSFEAKHWSKGIAKTAGLVSVKGKARRVRKFVFYKVKMGDREGIHFYSKTLTDRNKEFEKQKSKMTRGLIEKLRKAILG